MKKPIFALIALSAVTLGLGSWSWRNHIKNQVTIIETSDNVTHPLLHKGDTLVFQVPRPADGKQTYVHFDPADGKHPCVEKNITWDKNGHPPQCMVVEAPTKANSFYLYLIDTDPTETPMTKNTVRCPTWCPGAVVVRTESEPASGATPAKWLQQSDPYPVVEVGIFNLNGAPNPAYAALSQKVTWINPGTDAPGWTVTFDESNICEEGQTIPSASSIYCTVKPDAPPGYHNYTITVNTTPPTTGQTKSQLYVIPPPAPFKPQLP